MKKKIGIVTFHNVYNYGGVLQAYALCNALKDQDTECIDYLQADLTTKYSHSIFNSSKSLKENLKHFVRYYLLKRGVAKENNIKRFIEKYIPLSKKASKNLSEADLHGQDYDVLISGSDQIWNPKFTGGKVDPVYLLGFGRKNALRIAYASSAGAYKYNSDETVELKKAFDKYDQIAVREQFLQEQLNSFLTKQVKVVVDPTLLLNAEEWRKVEKPVKDIPENYILVYTFDDNLVCLELAKQMAIKLNCKIVSLSLKTQVHVDISINSAGPDEFVWLFDHAKFVVTNSFHGTTFSLIFRKDFFSIYKTSNPYRVLNLLESIGLQNRLVKNTEEALLQDVCIEYGTSSEKINELRMESKKYLLDSLPI